MMTRLLIVLIHGYRWLISPFLRPACRFEPTCSLYAIHALRYHGLGRGLYLISRRLLRCHPFEKLGGSWGYDPIPVRQVQGGQPSVPHPQKKTRQISAGMSR